MSPYNPYKKRSYHTTEYEKDSCIQKWYYIQGRYHLEAGVYRYGNSVPKFQVGPRKYNDRTIRIGRLTLDETVWLFSIMDEVIELLESEEDEGYED